MKQGLRERAPDLARLPLKLNLHAVSLAEGMRAALSVAAIMAAAEGLGLPVLREAALGALLTCLCDPGGPIRRRVPVLTGFMIAGALITAAGGLARGLGVAPALAFGGIGLFCLSFLRVYGQAQQQLGGLLGVVLILSLDRPLPSLEEAGPLALGFAGGAAWATLLTLVIWPIYPFAQARKAVAASYGALADLVADVHRLIREANVPQDAWELHARVHRRAVRDALETARATVLDTLRARGAASPRASQSLIRLEAADQIAGALLALSDVLERGSPQEIDAGQRFLRRLRPLLRELSRVIASEGVPMTARYDRTLAAMERGVAALPPDDRLRIAIDRIIERLRIALTLSTPENFLPGVNPAGPPIPILQRLLAAPQANLSWKSPALRHVLRVAVMGTLALAFGIGWASTYAHWLTITVVATMQPNFALTFARSVERVGGTIAGGIVAALVGAICTTPLEIAGAMFPLALIALTVRAVSFGLFMVALTPLVVLLVEVGHPGATEWTIVGMRAGLTAIGGILAVAASYLLWPEPQEAALSRAVSTAIAAHRSYADAQFARLLGEQAPAAVSRARRTAGQASNALETALNQTLIGMHRGRHATLEAVLALDATLRRLAGRISAASLDQDLISGLPRDGLSAWRAWIVQSLDVLAAGGNALAPRPDGTGTDSLRRIARQIELMAGTMEQIPGSSIQADRNA
ncbi:MAG: FUSC family protein [Acetobacteraceae bacterium]